MYPIGHAAAVEEDFLGVNVSGSFLKILFFSDSLEREDARDVDGLVAEPLSVRLSA